MIYVVFYLIHESDECLENGDHYRHVLIMIITAGFWRVCILELFASGITNHRYVVANS